MHSGGDHPVRSRVLRSVAGSIDIVFAVAGVIGVLWAMAVDSDRWWNVIDVSQVLPAIGATIAMARTALRSRSTAWWLFAVGTACWAVGQALWAWIAYSTDTDPTVTSWAYLPYAVFPVLGIVAVALIPMRQAGWIARLHLGAVTALIGGCLAFAAWTASIRPSTSNGVTAELVTALAYPVAGVVILSVLGAAASQRHDNSDIAFMAGIALVTAADGMYAVFVGEQRLDAYTLADVMWPVGFAVLVLAARWAPSVAKGPGDRFDDSAPLYIWRMACVPIGLAVAVGVEHTIVARPLDLPGVSFIALAALGVVGVLMSTERSSRKLTAALERQVRELAEKGQALAATSEQLAEVARTDPLTGLANRRRYLEELQDVLDQPGRTVAVVFADVDRFKIVNDSLGHAVGDELLRLIGARLVSVVRSSDLVARLGGDEFTVLLSDADETAAAALAKRVQEITTQPFAINGEIVHASLSIGVAFAVAGEDSALDLVRDADLAMYRAKVNGRARTEWFDTTARVHVARQHFLSNELRGVLDAAELEVWYQPLVNIATGGLIGLEALVRWPAGRGGEVPAAELVHVAEENGLIGDLTSFVLRRACADLAAWRLAALGDADHLTVAVNMSARHLVTPRVVSDVLLALHDARLPATALWLEITESALAGNTPQVQETLRTLHERGVRFSLDDFGTGYGSLSYLTQFPVEQMKIDRSFVEMLDIGADQSVIISALISLARSLGLSVVAEGVETQQQVDRLRMLGCTIAQGFLLGRAMPQEMAARFVRDHVRQPVAARQPAPRH